MGDRIKSAETGLHSNNAFKCTMHLFYMGKHIIRKQFDTKCNFYFYFCFSINLYIVPNNFRIIKRKQENPLIIVKRHCILPLVQAKAVCLSIHMLPERFVLTSHIGYLISKSLNFSILDRKIFQRRWTCQQYNSNLSW